MRHLLLPLLLLAGFASASQAGLYLREDYMFGSYSYRANSVSVSGILGQNALMGGEYSFYKDDNLPDVVHALRMPLYINHNKVSGFFRPLFYPSSKAIGTSAAGFNADAIFHLAVDEVNETRTQLAVNIAAAAQNATFGFGNGGSCRKMLPEVVYELQLQQNYFKEFFLLLNGSVYQYLTGIHNVSFPDLVLDQGDLASSGITRSLRELPQWNAGIEVNRSMDGSGDQQVYLQYHYIAFAQDYQAAHALTLGTRFKLSDNNSFDFGYNWIARGEDRKQNYYRVGFRLNF